MTWFKVDDGFYDHPKFIDLPNAAAGHESLRPHLHTNRPSGAAKRGYMGATQSGWIQPERGRRSPAILMSSPWWEELFTPAAIAVYARPPLGERAFSYQKGGAADGVVPHRR